MYFKETLTGFQTEQLLGQNLKMSIMYSVHLYFTKTRHFIFFKESKSNILFYIQDENIYRISLDMHLVF